MSCAATGIRSSAHDGKCQCSGYDVQPPLLKPWVDTLGQPNLFFDVATKLNCGNDEEGDHQVMWK